MIARIVLIGTFALFGTTAALAQSATPPPGTLAPGPSGPPGNPERPGPGGIPLAPGPSGSDVLGETVGPGGIKMAPSQSLTAPLDPSTKPATRPRP